MIYQPNCVDRDRIAELAARVEREDPDWRSGKPVFVSGQPIPKRQAKPLSGGRKPRRVWFIPLVGPTEVYETALDAGAAKGVSRETIYQSIAASTPIRKCPGRFMYEPRTEDGRRIARAEAGSAA